MPAITAQIIQALCRTLFHSLWQGLLIAVAAGIVILFTKKLRPSSRYNILTLLLLVFTTGIAVTFYHELSTAGRHSAAYINDAANGGLAAGNTTPLQTQAVSAAGQANILQFVSAWANAHAGMIVCAWLLVIAFRCLQMLIGLRGVYLLKRKAVFSAGAFWNNRMQQLAQNIHVKRQVTLLQSAIAKVPMVIGHFKPFILLPAGVLTALPQDEIEAILLHELAHIRRKDYLVNMLQNFCAILFFFNPAVLWLSSLIKEERENCCDDIALGEVKNKGQFIHVLISFQEYNMAASNYAVGFPGRRDHLLNRVKRIITNNNKSLTNMEKTFLATGIVLVSFVTIAIAQPKQLPHINKQAEAIAQTAQNDTAANAAAREDEATQAIAANQADDAAKNANTGEQLKDTIPAGQMNEQVWVDGDSSTCNINTSYDGKEYIIKLRNDKLAELTIDGQKIPAEKFAGYQATVDDIVATVKEQGRQARMMAAEARAQARVARQQSDTMRRQATQARIMAEQARIKREQTDTMRVRARQMAEQVREQARVMRIQADTMRVQARQMAEQAREQARVNRASDTLRAQARIIAEPAREQARVMRIQADTMRRQGEQMRIMASQQRLQAAQSRRDAQQMMDNFAADLVDEGIVKDKDEALSFSLNGDELVVNGVKQPEALHQKLKSKYLQSAGDNLSFSRSGNSKSANISIQRKK